MNTNTAVKNVLLKLSYNGEKYHGFSYQPGLPTVEYFIFWSFIKSKLIKVFEGVSNPSEYTFPKTVLNRITLMKYQKCGRTDAGVSAAAQYISIFLPVSEKSEYPYDLIINQHLPDTIRVLGWIFVEDSFSARFSCTSREYEYYFSRAQNGLNIQRMEESAKKLVGTHWFGRLAKQEKEVSKKKRMEKKQKLESEHKDVEEYVRTVDSITFEKVSDDLCTGIEVYLMRIKARSFLHNQVRKIFGLLSMIGTGSDISIENILNKNEPQKKDIKLSEPHPLVLAKCTFHKINLNELNHTPSKRWPLQKLCESVFVRSKVNERIAKELI